jgi:hypothetical protein
MPQPDSSRKPLLHEQWSEAEPWPALPPSPPRRVPPRARPAAPAEAPAEDGRSPADPDGNQEQERELREAAGAPSRRADDNGGAPGAEGDADNQAASRRFSADDELEDTWPNIPGRDLEE